MMQNEGMMFNGEESNDSEMLLLGQGCSQLENLLLANQEPIMESPDSRERELDEQLKALDLYEEDMTLQQKEELLTVLAASRETAEQESARRERIGEYDADPQELSNGNDRRYHNPAWEDNEESVLQTLLPASTSPPPYCDALAKVSPTVRELELALQDGYLTNEATSEPPPDENDLASQGLFDSSAVIDHLVDSDLENQFSMSTTSSSHSSRKSKKRSRKSKKRSRSSHSHSSRSKVSRIDSRIEEDDEFGDPSQAIIDMQIDLYQQKLLLEKSMSKWKPCQSPEAERLSCSRTIEEDPSHVPYNCSGTDCTQAQRYLTSFEHLHSTLISTQSISSKFIPWGKPVTVVHHPYGTRHTGRTANDISELGSTPQELLCDVSVESERFPFHDSVTQTSESALSPKDTPHATIEELFEESRVQKSKWNCDVATNSLRSRRRSTRSPESHRTRKHTRVEECESPVENDDPCSSRVSFNSDSRLRDSETVDGVSNGDEHEFDFELSVRKHNMRTYSKRCMTFAKTTPVVESVANHVLEDQENSVTHAKENVELENLISAIEDEYPIDVETPDDEQIRKFVAKRKRSQDGSPCRKSKRKSKRSKK